MPTSSRRFGWICACLGFPAFLITLCPIGQSGDLEAAPWKHVVGVNEQSLPGNGGLGMFFEMSPEDIAALPGLAREGNALAAAMMGAYSRHEREDMARSARWLRVAVENGDVDSAFALGELYFPTGGTFGREDFAFKPDIVLGYVWYAIGLSGLSAVEEKGGEARMDIRRAREMVDGLRMLLLPSERVRIVGILSGWPDTPPPDTPLEPMPGKPDDRDGDGEDFPDAPPDADTIVELVRQWTTGRAESGAAVSVLSNAPPEFAPVLRDAFEKIRTLAEEGDKEAEYMVAWCRLCGLGTPVDEKAALPAIVAKAETGDVNAMFLAAVSALKGEDAEQAIDFATRAAEKGHGRSMMLLSQVWRDRDDRKAAALWMERAAAAGEWLAIQEMIGVAESSGDWEKIVFWLTVAMIRAPDPAMAYRCRMLVAYVGSDAGEEAVRKAMEAGERWHNEHPPAIR